jgi:DNA-binding LytR/AlgR family response regulator
MGDFWKIMHGYFRNLAEADGIVYFKDVIYLQGCGSYTLVFVKDGRWFRLSYNLGRVINEMGVVDFFRCHRSYYANLRHIVRLVFDKDGNGEWLIEYPNNVFVKVATEESEELAVAWFKYKLCRPPDPILN